MAEGLGDFFDIAVRWHDATTHGSLLSNRLRETIRHRLYPRTWAQLAPEMEKPPAARRRIPADALARIVLEDRSSDTHLRIVDDSAFWRPDAAQVRPASVDIGSEACGSRASLALAEGDCAQIRHWARTGETDQPALLGLGKMTDDRLAAFRRTSLARGDTAPLMIGHACVSWSDGDLRLWTDPFVRPKRLRYPAGQQPLSPLDAPEEAHIVLITHCHPDHFDPASLLLFPATATIVVPPVPHETPLAFDMALRARQLGFSDVRTLGWNETLAIGGFTITALPFYGEQPLGAHATPGGRTDRNQGSTYHVAGPGGLTALFLADAGSDPTGSALALARRVRRSAGRVDLLFGNHRRWLVYPPQFITTSIPHYLCYVPDDELAVPQPIMLTPEQLTEIGAVLSARHVIPYAMGNAPWFAEIGLGPADASAGPAGAFDGPVRTESDPDTLVAPAARQTLLTPGDQIESDTVRRDDRFAPIDPAAFPAAPAEPAPPRALAIGGIDDPQILRDLLELTRVDPASYLVAAPGFVEIATTDPAGGVFLWDLVARLVDRPAWTIWSAHPLASAPFAGDAGWLRLFEAHHHRASCALREGGDAIAAIRPLVDALRSSSAPVAIERIAHDLVGLTFSLAPAERRTATPCPDNAIELPPAAAGLVATQGHAAVTAALLLVKLLHNVVLTMQALEHPACRSEADAFADVLMDHAAAPVEALA